MDRGAVIHPLVAILAEERDALISGDFDGLPGIALRREGILADLAVDGIDRDGAILVDAALARNQALLATAIAGVRSVGRRMEQLVRLRDGYETYDSSGTRARLGADGPAFERKA